MLWQQRPALVLQVWREHTPLALDGAFVWWMTGRASGIACSWPPGAPEVPE
jgi:hypothetical protein